MITPDLIREARLRGGLSQRQLGERLGCHPTIVSRWERGLVLPSLETVREVIRACGLELGFELANRDETEHDAVLIERTLGRTPAQRLSDGLAAHNAIERFAGRAAGAGRDG